MTNWADIFPEMDAFPTKDARVFQTPFKKMGNESKYFPLESIPKHKQFFCCIVGGDCYGVDVIRPASYNAREECEEAFLKVQAAADYYEEHGLWPPRNYRNKTRNS